MDEFNDKIGRYEVTENEDGTRNIIGVPIFKLGTFKSKNGVAYDDDWFEKAKERHEQLKKENEYLPTVHAGHNKDDGSELPAMGLFDNLRKKGAMVLADIVRIGKAAYQELKDGLWPYRSVEAINTEDEARILSLAVLGSRPPAVKTPPLYAQEHFDGATEDIDTFKIIHETTQDDSFMVAEETQVSQGIELQTILDDKTSENIEMESNETNHEVTEGNMSEEAKTEETTEEVTEEKVEEKEEEVAEEEVEEEAVEKKEEDKKDDLLDKLHVNERDQMAEKIAALEEEVKSLRGDADQAKEEKRMVEVDSFIETRNKAGKLPISLVQYDGNEDGTALRDLLLKASDEVRGEIMRLVDAMPKAVNFKETAVAGDDEAKEGGLDITKLAEKYAKEHDVDFKTALRQVQIENKIQ